jgi:hypothetical protein
MVQLVFGLGVIGVHDSRTSSTSGIGGTPF